MAELRLGPTYLLSDLHLRGPSDANQSRFLRFIDERIAPYSDRTLVIAGDLFDFWYAVGDEVPESCRAVLDRLAALPRVVWLEGNHDIGQSRRLAEQGGLQVLSGALQMKCGSLSVHVCHGDRLDQRDLGQRMLRSLLDSSAVRVLAGRLGSPRVQQIGISLASRSRRRYPAEQRGRDESWFQAAESDAAERIAAGTDLCVRGHSHSLGWWPSGLICLGDWLWFHSYLELQPQGQPAQLRRYVPGSSADPVLCCSAEGQLTADRSIHC